MGGGGRKDASLAPRTQTKELQRHKGHFDKEQIRRGQKRHFIAADINLFLAVSFLLLKSFFFKGRSPKRICFPTNKEDESKMLFC